MGPLCLPISQHSALFNAGIITSDNLRHVGRMPMLFMTSLVGFVKSSPITSGSNTLQPCPHRLLLSMLR
ncbi:hypothetical protein V6N11_027930 [Hibiscus sabdariffa]|uniref:Uncharacterized protein n=1 Tax=Hibiscus sabdariffa TaxID=183260 RepID=A0ABR2NZD3_9ROSI